MALMDPRTRTLIQASVMKDRMSYHSKLCNSQVLLPINKRLAYSPCYFTAPLLPDPLPTAAC